MTNTKSFSKQAMNHFKRWEKRFRKEMGEYPGILFDIEGATGGQFDDTELVETMREQASDALDAQVEFIEYRVIYLMMNGEYKKNLDRIERFLSYQYLAPDHFAIGEEPAFTVVFPKENARSLVVRLNKMTEFDFVDAWDQEEKQLIFVENSRYRNWTENRVDRFLDGLFEDFGFDQFDLKNIKVRKGQAGEPWGDGIWIEYEVHDEDLESEDMDTEGNWEWDLRQ